MWDCSTEISIVLNTRNVETALKYFAPSFARQSHLNAYIVKCFTLVYRFVLCHSSQICGEMLVDLLANKTCEHDFWDILYTPKMQLTQFGD